MEINMTNNYKDDTQDKKTPREVPQRDNKQADRQSVGDRKVPSKDR
jgi:hypothetical protein